MTNAEMFEYTFGEPLRVVYYSRPQDFVKWSDAEYKGEFAIDNSDDLVILNSHDRSKILSEATELMKRPSDNYTAGEHLGAIMSLCLNEEEKRCFIEILQKLYRESISKLLDAVKGER